MAQLSATERIPSPDHVHARLECRTQALGMETPETDTHLSALNVDGVWILYVWTLEQDQEALERWIEEIGDFQPRPDQTTNHVLAVQTEDLPPILETLFERYGTESLILRSDGTATLKIHTSRREAKKLHDEFEATLLQISDTSQEENRQSNPLTQAERKTLLAAYKAGYFEVPRRLRQRELAEQLGKSTGALSALLRKATQSLIEHHLQDAARRPIPTKEKAPESSPDQGP